MRTRDGRRRDEGRTVGTPEERQAMSGPAPGQARPAGRQPIDPRFRRRWVEARRAEGRRRLRALLAGLSVAALAGLATGLLYSPLLRVRDVVVVGDVHTPRAAVLAAAGLSVPGRVPMLDAGSASEVRAVEALPWVARASFTKRWPWTVVVSVHERRPVAVVADGAGQALVDGSGRVLEAGRRLAEWCPCRSLPGQLARCRAARSGQAAGPARRPSPSCWRPRGRAPRLWPGGGASRRWPARAGRHGWGGRLRWWCWGAQPAWAKNWQSWKSWKGRWTWRVIRWWT